MKKHFERFLYNIRSMRTQLFVVIIVAGLLPVVVFSIIMILSYNVNLIEHRTDELKSYGNVLSNLINETGYLQGNHDADVEQEAKSIAGIYQGRVFIIDQDLKVLNDTYNLETGKTVVSSEVIKSFLGNGESYSYDLGDYVQLNVPIINPADEKIAGVIVITFSTQSYASVASILSQRSIILILTIFIILLLIAYFYSGKVIVPFKNVSNTIDKISEGDMNVTLDIKSYTELMQIAESFNRMISIIQSQDEAKQSFASNVSHELKTPLASMKVLSDSLLSQESVPEELYREFLVDITDEIERMTNIINDLLTMVKLEKNAAVMNITNISINDLIEQLLKRLKPIAAARDIELIYESYRPVMADVDEVKLSIALNNLIENAIKYNYDEGWVKVTINADHKFFYIKIEDSGVGIPEELQDKVFDRFYRVDKARSRATGGTGLGLALTRSTVILHRGSIKLYSKPKEGSTFTLRIPLSYVTNE